MTATTDRGRKLLIVEDEVVIAMFLENEAARAGFRVLPTQTSVAGALLAVDAAPPDAAILDLQIAGETAYPVAEALMARGVPFVFTSGRNAVAPPRYRSVPLVTKPFEFADVMDALAAAENTGARP